MAERGADSDHGDAPLEVGDVSPAPDAEAGTERAASRGPTTPTQARADQVSAANSKVSLPPRPTVKAVPNGRTVTGESSVPAPPRPPPPRAGRENEPGSAAPPADDAEAVAALDPDEETAVEHDIDIEDELTAEQPLPEGDEVVLQSDPEPPVAAPAERAAETVGDRPPDSAVPAEELSDDDIEEELDDAALEDVEPGSPPGIPALRAERPRLESTGPADDRADAAAGRGVTKRRVRNTLRIPDDDVPAATPAPPAVKPAEPSVKPAVVEAPAAGPAVGPAPTERPVDEAAAETMPAPVATLPPPPRASAPDRAPQPPTPAPMVGASGERSARELPPQRTRSGTIVMKPEPAAPGGKTLPEGGSDEDVDWSPVAPAVKSSDPAAAEAAETPDEAPSAAEPAAVEAEAVDLTEQGKPAAATTPASELAPDAPPSAPEAVDSAAKTLPDAAAPPPEPPTLPIGTKVPRVATNDGPPVIEALHSRPPIPRPHDSNERSVRSRRPVSPPHDEHAPASSRPSAPSGVVTDQQSVGLILPVFVSSDLPPVESQRGRKVAPPRRLSREDEAFDGIEEIEPEAEITVPDGRVPKGPPADTPSPPAGESALAAGRRAPPPRRPRSEDEGGIEVDLELEDQAAEGAPTPRPPAVAPAPAAVPPPPPVPPPPVFETPAAEPAAAEAEAAAPAAEPKPTGTPAPKAPKRKKPWWSDLFEEDYVKTHDIPIDKDVVREADFIERVLNLAKGARVLDLGCGLGRHAVELASRGYEMVGVDHSTLMLAKANEHAAERGLGVNFVKGDMRKLSLDAVFDGIYCWSQTFGYFDEQTNHAVLESIHRALRPGGTFALDVANRDFVAPRSPTMVWFERPGCVCMDEMKFDFYTSRMIVKRTVLFETGRSREIEYSMRMYSLHELGRMLHGCGFRVLEVSGHRAHPGTYFGSESPRIIVAAERV